MECVGQGEMLHLVRYESFQACLGIFIETFQECYGEGVAQTVVGGLVVDGVAGKPRQRVVGVGVIVLGCVVGLIDMAVVVKFDGVDEARHRHILIFQPGGVGFGHRGVFWSRDAVGTVVGQLLVIFFLVEGAAFFLCLFARLLLGFVGIVFLLRLDGEFLRFDFLLGHGHFAVESQTVAVGVEDVLEVVAVPVFGQHGGQLADVVIVTETFRMGDKVVVGDAAVFRLLVMHRGEEQVCLVAVADIRAIEGVVEEGGTVVLIVPTPVDVVKLHSHTDGLACIDSEECLEMVLAIGAVAAGVKADVGDG